MTQHSSHNVHLCVAGRSIAPGMVDLLQDETCFQDAQATPTIGFRDQSRQVSCFGQLLYKRLGILAFFVQLTPVRARIELAQVVHRLAERLLLFRQCDTNLSHASVSPLPLALVLRTAIAPPVWRGASSSCCLLFGKSNCWRLAVALP